MTSIRLLGAGLILSLFLFGCKAKTEVEKAIRPVKVMTVEGSNNTSIHTFPGKVKESREVKLAFRVPGPLVQLNAKEGMFVKKGDLLAEIDPRDFEVNLEAAKTNWQHAKQDAKRYQELYEKKSIPESTKEKVEVAAAVAESNFNKATNALNDTKLFAPFDGYVQTKMVENFEKVGAGYPILTLLDVSVLEVIAGLPESIASHSGDFKSYTCTVKNGKTRVISAKLKEISKKTAGNNQMYPIRVYLNKEESKNLRPGMNASLNIEIRETTTEDGFELPVASIINYKGKSIVWVYNEKQNLVNQREVEVVRLLANDKVLVRKGILEGEQIVVAGATFLIDKQAVKLLTEKTNSNIGGLL
ncbi:efflux RND transporter periplasmic adaptor subunit [Ancylomarina sp.]|uniref:efflux RND transporter periplasmic adaptor subunit n=1 Tax=Ancylomarina sp. TaxID=1970196 RepID=UPI0035686EC1